MQQVEFFCGDASIVSFHSRNQSCGFGKVKLIVRVQNLGKFIAIGFHVGAAIDSSVGSVDVA